MAKFLNIELDTDVDSLRNKVYETLQEHFSEWEPFDGNLETWMVEAFTQAVSDLRDLAADVPIAIFKQYGETIIGIPVNSASSATSTVTIETVDTAGYKIPAGTELGLRVNGELIGFKTVQDAVVVGGSNVVAGVPIAATEPGADADALTGEMIVISSVLGEPKVTLDKPTSGGEDEETEVAYLERLVEELQILSPTPIKPQDFVVIARRRPEVGRAVALNLYNPATGTFENERYVTTVVHDPLGEELTDAVKEEIEEELEELREVNFRTPVIDPNYQEVDVKLTVTAYSGYDKSALAAVIESQLAGILSPARFGSPLFGQPGEWVLTDKVHLSKIEVGVGMVRGVDYITEVKIRKHNVGEYKAEDLTLTGPAPLTRLGSVTITVNEP